MWKKKSVLSTESFSRTSLVADAPGDQSEETHKKASGWRIGISQRSRDGTRPDYNRRWPVGSSMLGFNPVGSFSPPRQEMEGTFEDVEEDDEKYREYMQRAGEAALAAEKKKNPEAPDSTKSQSYSTSKQGDSFPRTTNHQGSTASKFMPSVPEKARSPPLTSGASQFDFPRSLTVDSADLQLGHGRQEERLAMGEGYDDSAKAAGAGGATVPENEPQRLRKRDKVRLMFGIPLRQPQQQQELQTQQVPDGSTDHRQESGDGGGDEGEDAHSDDDATQPLRIRSSPSAPTLSSAAPPTATVARVVGRRSGEGGGGYRPRTPDPLEAYSKLGGNRDNLQRSGFNSSTLIDH